MDKFTPTHTIYANGRRIPIRMMDDICYTRAEWDSGTSADWEVDSKEFCLRFQGDLKYGATIRPKRK